jgi:exodeoxyribonuclease V alpha subunit
MIDISLMTHLFEAVPPKAKLILLGDKDQLASVETGSIFRDLCFGNALASHRVVLQKSYRFVAEDGIGQLAQAIREANEVRMLEVLASPDFADVTLDESLGGLDAEWLRSGWQDYVAAISSGNLEAIFRAFNALRILTPLRKGRMGVEGLNPWVDGVMQRLLPTHAGAQKPWYIGRPVMVTQNDYRQNLFNGDIGIVLPNDQGELRVWFPSGEAGQYRAVAPIRLLAHETAWVMTIHKSQGSEFTQVLLILPETEDLPLLGRELLYTAVTRAKQGIHILASRATLGRALRQVTPPASQLQERLLASPTT